MLRIFVLLLLLVNAGFFAWQQGMLAPLVGDIAGSQREPERLAQQVNPQLLVVEGELPPTPAPALEPIATAEAASDAALLPAESTVADAASVPLQSASGAAAAASDAPATALTPPPLMAPAAGATQCLEAGPYSREEESQIQTALGRALPAGSWRVDRFPVPGLWLIYMGPYPDDATLKGKQGELQRIGGISFEEVRSPVNLRMGLSLGRFNSQSAADAALNTLQAKGVRTARVASVRPPMDVSVIRVQQADAKMQQQLKGLSLPPDRGFVGCLVP